MPRAGLGVPGLDSAVAPGESVERDGVKLRKISARDREAAFERLGVGKVLGAAENTIRALGHEGNEELENFLRAILSDRVVSWEAHIAYTSDDDRAAAPHGKPAGGRLKGLLRHAYAKKGADEAAGEGA